MSPPDRPTATDRASLIAALRARVHEVGISYDNLDSMIGWADKLTSKYLGPAMVKPLGMDAFLNLLTALAWKIEFVPDMEAARRMEALWEKWEAGKVRANLRRLNRVQPIGKETAQRLAKQLGQRGGRARMTTISPKKRSQVARMGGRAKSKKYRAAKRLAQKAVRLERGVPVSI